MTKIFIIDEKTDLNEIKKCNHCYIVAKNGIFFKDVQDRIESCTEIETINCLKNIKPYIKWGFPKISKDQIKLIVAFFKNVYTQLATECMVLIGWNDKEEKIVIVPPTTQKVTSASIKYTMDKIPGVRIIGSVHSHASMSAFHSGVDIKDEMNFDGLHITLGSFNKNNDNFEISCQLTSGDNREDIAYNEVIEGINELYDVALSMKKLSSCDNAHILQEISKHRYEIKKNVVLSIDSIELLKEEEKIIEDWNSSIVKSFNNNINRYNSINGGGYGGFVSKYYSGNKKKETEKKGEEKKINKGITLEDIYEDDLLYDFSDDDDIQENFLKVGNM